MNEIEASRDKHITNAGTLCVIDLSRFACYGYDQRIEVFGTKGMICSDNMKPNSNAVSDGSGSSMYVV